MNSLRLIPNNFAILKPRIHHNVYQASRVISDYRYKKRKERENPDVPKNLLAEYNTAHLQPGKGVPYDCKPFKMVLEANKDYMWCSCGQGHNQPMCDGTHLFRPLQIKLRPVRVRVAKTQEYWLCNCKQTKNRPFCDGSHKNSVVVEACKNKHVCTG